MPWQWLCIKFVVFNGYEQVLISTLYKTSNQNHFSKCVSVPHAEEYMQTMVGPNSQDATNQIDSERNKGEQDSL